MEKVTAYKAFNGRLFDTEAKCIAYEKKMNKYPMVQHKTETHPEFDIVEHIIRTKVSPSAQWSTEKYYIVAGNYKITCNYDLISRVNSLVHTVNEMMTYYCVDVYITKEILRIGSFNDDIANHIVKEYHTSDDYSKMAITENIPNKKWRFEDTRWHTGSIMPYIVQVEKIN